MATKAVNHRNFSGSGRKCDDLRIGSESKLRQSLEGLLMSMGSFGSNENAQELVV